MAYIRVFRNADSGVARFHGADVLNDAAKLRRAPAAVGGRASACHSIFSPACLRERQKAMVAT